EARYEAAARGLELAEASAVPTAGYEARVAELRATVQAALPGRVATDDARLAPVAGSLLRDLHAADVCDLDVTGSVRQLAAAACAGRVVAAIAPELERRVHVFLDRLAAALPAESDAVCSHGDFEVGQLIEHRGEVSL